MPYELTERAYEKSQRQLPPGSSAAAHLAACLALVRPVTMSDSAVSEWLTVAVAAVKSYPAIAIEKACKLAQRECFDHRKIVPAVIAECERLANETAELERHRAIPGKREALPAPRPTLAEIEANERWLNTPGDTQAKLRSMGLETGALETVNGRVKYIPALR